MCLNTTTKHVNQINYCQPTRDLTRRCSSYNGQDKTGNCHSIHTGKLTCVQTVQSVQKCILYICTHSPRYLVQSEPFMSDQSEAKECRHIKVNEEEANTQDHIQTSSGSKNDRVKVYWSEEGILSYKDVVSPQLSSLRELWDQSSSKSLASVLLQSTNQILAYAASITNRVTALGKKRTLKSAWKPPEIYLSELSLRRAHKSLKRVKKSETSSPEQIADARLLHKEEKSSLRRLVRLNRLNDNIKRDTRLSSILSSNPSAAHRILKSVKSGSSHHEIQKLKVGDKEYYGENVPDGFYDSLKSLKTKDTSSHFDSFQELKSDYENMFI